MYDDWFVVEDYTRVALRIYIYIIMIVLEWIEFRFIAGETKMIEI